MPQYTPNYQIPYPVNGDPIHLGAEQMQALATKVDSQLKDVSDASALDATSLATPGRIIQRDSAGRARVAAPSAAADIAIKSTVDAVGSRLGGLTFQTRTTAPPSNTPSTTITFVVS